MAGPDSKRHQRQQQGIGTGRATYRRTNPEVRRNLLLKGLDFRPQYEVLTLHNAMDRRQDFVPNHLKLGLKIEKREERIPITRFERA